ncbi:hypothetical protein F2P79_009086 [Pimephales promelas]|nr:hypothetical protein F2P79_009086 [Pimephales promelas]
MEIPRKQSVIDTLQNCADLSGSWSIVFKQEITVWRRLKGDRLYLVTLGGVQVVFLMEPICEQSNMSKSMDQRSKLTAHLDVQLGRTKSPDKAVEFPSSSKCKEGFSRFSNTVNEEGQLAYSSLLLRSQFGRQPAHNTWRIPARLWRKGSGAIVEGFRFSTTEMSTGAKAK